MNTAKSILSTRARALGAYRAVMRAQKTTFQGDFPAQTAARLQVREHS